MKFEGFRPKTAEELENQAQKSQEILGEKIYPPDISSSDTLDISNIKTEYKTRYDSYLQTLRAEKKGELDTKEIQHAKEWIKALNNLDDYIKDHESKSDPLLREKQFVVYKKIRDFLEQGKRKGYIKLPAGTGKTILFSKIAEALDMKTLIASPSKTILNQNAEETEEFTDSEYGKYYGLEKELDKKVTHITYHSLVNAVRDGKINPEDVPVLILDEAHRSLGPKRSKTVRKFKGLQLGFTATSEFSESKKLSDLLEEEVFRMDVKDAIQEGLICQTQTIHAYTDVDLSSVSITNGKFDNKELEKVVNTHGRNMATLELYKNKFSELKAFCNCSGVNHAQDVAKLFNEQGIPADCITGTTSKEERILILDEYKNGVIKVLTNARVLLEGFDEPSCSVTFNLHPTLSLVDAEQRARSGRLDKNNPDKWNYVIDFIDQNSLKPQVLYSEILGADIVQDISNTENNNTQIDTNNAKRESTTRPPIDLSNFSMDGLKVVVDTQTIMEVTNRNSDSREKWTYKTLQADVITKGIISSADYLNRYAIHNWPSRNTIISYPEFPKKSDGSNDWDTFLGKEKFDFEKFRLGVLSKGIKSSDEYSNQAPANNWPAVLTLKSKLEFPKNQDGSADWSTFLGKEKFDFEKFRLEVISNGIKSQRDYMKKAPVNNWPSLGTLIRKSEFPKNQDGSADWSTFFGKEKSKKFTFETLRSDVLSKGIKSQNDYKENAPLNNWFSPNTLIRKSEFPKNQDGSADWSTFLGKEKFDFEKFRLEVLDKGINSANDYTKNVRLNNWPSFPTLVKMPEFPKKPDGSNDWNTFLGKNK